MNLDRYAGKETDGRSDSKVEAKLYQSQVTKRNIALYNEAYVTMCHKFWQMKSKVLWIAMSTEFYYPLHAYPPRYTTLKAWSLPVARYKSVEWLNLASLGS